MLLSMVVYIAIVAGVYAFVTYALVRAIKLQARWTHLAVPIILFSCCAAVGVPSIIRMSAYNIFTKFDLVSFTLGGALGILTMLIYRSRFASIFALDNLKDISIVQRTMRALVFLGIMVMVGLLFVLLIVVLAL